MEGDSWVPASVVTAWALSTDTPSLGAWDECPITPTLFLVLRYFLPTGVLALVFPLSCLLSRTLVFTRLTSGPFFLQPEDLEAPKTHHFKVKAFKKVKPCGICRQAITREGCICKGAWLMRLRACCCCWTGLCWSVLGHVGSLLSTVPISYHLLEDTGHTGHLPR